MVDLAIIGGTGLTSLSNLEIIRREVVHTPYGEPSGPLTFGHLCGKEVVFLARHGYGHTIPPHMVNYRANIRALRETGVERVIAVAAVGGISADLEPGRLVIPNQVIDYTYGRYNTFFEEGLERVTHVDFTEPYSEALRGNIIEACRASGIEICSHGVYGATQGPRLETAAEIDRMERDGCTLVGMTGMPEAVLARELDLGYATCAVIANKAAGRGTGPISMDEIEMHIQKGMQSVRLMLEKVIELL
jgi:5'-methylthioinosine phosphorylase